VEVGGRGHKTLKRLWARISHLKPFAVATDGWRAYRKIIPPNLLLQTKALTCTVESVNSQVRHYIARFHRKTKCYSKSTRMAELALYLCWQQYLS
jgi:insertion element IS1 protein InsB